MIFKQKTKNREDILHLTIQQKIIPNQRKNRSKAHSCIFEQLEILPFQVLFNVNKCYRYIFTK